MKKYLIVLLLVLVCIEVKSQNSEVEYKSFSSTKLVKIVEKKDTVRVKGYYSAKIYVPGINLKDPNNKVEVLYLSRIRLPIENDYFPIFYTVQNFGAQNKTIKPGRWECEVKISTKDIDTTLFLYETYSILPDTTRPIKMDFVYNPEIEAQFQGGKSGLFDYLNKNLKVNSAHKGKKMIFSLIISSNGKVENHNIDRGFDEEVDRELIRIFYKMPKWVPAKDKGKPVKSKLQVTYFIGEKL